jgi:hypothetical protein
MATTAQRAHIHNLLTYLSGRHLQVRYPPHDVRGALDLRTFKLTEQQLFHLMDYGGEIQADCSELATEVCRWAGLADPNGLGYRYAGYTGTMLAHLPHYTDPKRALVGALVVFGPGTGEHVAQVYEPGDDPLLVSHGIDRTVNKIPLSVERSYHKPPVTFCSIARL